MATTKTAELTGALVLSGSCGCGSGGDCPFVLSSRASVQANVQGDLSINSPVSWVDLLAGTGITTATVVALKVSNPTNFEVRLTTAAGADQVLRLSDSFNYISPVTGQGITALAVRGVGELTRMIAGT